MIQPDGSRAHLSQYYDSTIARWQYKTTDGTFLIYNDQNGKLRYPDGSVVKYDLVNNRLLPTSIQNRNGDLMTIAYKTKTSSFSFRWAIDSIVDTLGRVIQFNYDAASGALISITAPDKNGATRTIAQIDYQEITLQYSFASPLTVEASSPASGSQLSVVRRIYYPATGRGFVFTNYSGYGMAKKISSRMGMASSSDGTEAAYTEYTYAETGSLNDSPQFAERKEWWQGKTNSNGTTDNTPTVYSYSRSYGTGTEIETVAYPNNLDIVTTIDTSSTSSLSYGKALSVVHKNRATQAILRQTDYSYAYPVDGGVQIGSVTTTNEAGQKTKISYDYGYYGRVTNFYEHGLREGGFKVRRRTSYNYLDNSAHLDVSLYHLVAEVKVHDALFNDNNSDDIVKAKAVYTYDDYAPKGGMETYGLSATTYPPNHDSKYKETKLERGNITAAQVWSDIAANISTTRYTRYDIFGNVVEADVSCCQVKSFAFNSTNYYSQPAQATDGRNGTVPFLTTSYSYDFNTGLVSSVTDPNNLTTSFTYDAAWRLASVAAPGGAVTTSGFDKGANGNDLLSFAEKLTYTDNGAGKTLTARSWLDGAGRAVKSGSGAGNSPSSYDMISIVYDSLGRVAKHSNPYAGNSSGSGAPQYWTASTYDELSRVTTVTLPDNQTVKTSYSGLTVTVTDQVGRQRQSESDGLGRLVKVIEQNPATGALDATNYLTSYSYDMIDNLISVNQGVQARSFSYDALSRLKSQTTPEAGTESFTYTNFDAIATRTDARGVVTTYGYDSLNRLQSITYNTSNAAGVAATTAVTLSYNNYSTPQAGNGMVSSVSDSAGTESYGYDSLGRVATKTRVIDSRSYASQYLDNPAGQMTTLIYPSGKRVRLNHDSRGRMSGVDKVDSSGNVTSQYVTSVGYNTAGMVTSIALANGVNESFDCSVNPQPFIANFVNLRRICLPLLPFGTCL